MVDRFFFAENLHYKVCLLIVGVLISWTLVYAKTFCFWCILAQIFLFIRLIYRNIISIRLCLSSALLASNMIMLRDLGVHETCPINWTDEGSFVVHIGCNNLKSFLGLPFSIWACGGLSLLLLWTFIPKRN